ncbi:DUF2513 domain-containing protein [Staphylococcus xylosus]
MELKHDLLRNIMLDIESSNEPEMFEANTLFPKYGKTDVLYTLTKLMEAQYINSEPVYYEGRIQDYRCMDLTFSGHEFLDNIRDEKVWAEVKKTTKQLSSVSVSILSKIGYKYLSTKFGLD